mmetsp:Transcript_16432/g.67737  ORF Transcript_16432/g.67737 Transcript_16432/m.67737 type:complete len:85 (-) Transcript_16432:50-304(-)
MLKLAPQRIGCGLRSQSCSHFRALLVASFPKAHATARLKLNMTVRTVDRRSESRSRVLTSRKFFEKPVDHLHITGAYYFATKLT